VPILISWAFMVKLNKSIRVISFFMGFIFYKCKKNCYSNKWAKHLLV